VGLGGVFFCAGAAYGADPSGKRKIVFVAGKPSHGFAQHEHNAGCQFLARCLSEGMPDIVTKVYLNGWPKEKDAFEGADAIIMYCDGGGGHMVVPHLKEMDELAKKGVGIGCIHYAVEVEDNKGGDEFLRWIGGYFQPYRSINPTWQARFTDIPKHEVTRGVRPFTTHDEWYYHMRFRDGMNGVTSILAAVPAPGLHGTDKSHDGNEEVHHPNRHEPETVVWVAEDPQTHQRGFGCTGGHYHFNWAQDDFRKTILNCIVWAAHGQVPEGGVQSKRPTVDDLLANLDPKNRGNFDPAKEQREIERMNEPIRVAQ
jgi:type 1 glutamine amidotransferase